MMLKGRSRDPRTAVPPTPTMSIRSSTLRPPMAKPEPDYEVVEFPSEQYVNAKLQPPPPPPPRPPTGHPQEAGASCGLCGGGGARVRCAECGRRALCASCDDMYHRHPKRRHHQRQALSLTQLRDERPPLPPKTGPPVPPPRKHKISGDRSSASPRPTPVDQRGATLSMMSPIQTPVMQAPPAIVSIQKHFMQRPQQPSMNVHPNVQTANIGQTAHAHLGSLPYLSATMHHNQPPVAPTQEQSNTLGHVPNAWGRQRTSLPGFMPPNMPMAPGEAWETPENAHPSAHMWGRPLRRGTSVMELGIGPPPNPCSGCAHCMGQPWRYGSCASLDHNWVGPWPTCCVGPHPQQNARMPIHPHAHPPPQTPQPYRRAESRAVSRAASRAGSRAPSPAVSVRSRTSRRHKHRTPSPPPLPSSDADSESEVESEGSPTKDEEDQLGPPPPPPNATWQCEHCTFVNDPGVRVCVVCCRTPTITPKIINDVKNGMRQLKITNERSPSVARSILQEPASKHVEVKAKTKKTKERTSTACGPSPPRDDRGIRKPLSRLSTPAGEEINNQPTEVQKTRHDMAVGPSPPKDTMNSQNISLNTKTISSSHKNNVVADESKRHSVSVGPSPPREQTPSSRNQTTLSNQKKSTGTSPPRDTRIDRPSSLLSSTSSRANVSNTGTSPPPQSISTQTYDVPNTREYERAPSVTRSRARRRFREDTRRERSHSRHSLSSDTRESERSVRTGGGSNLGPGRWEWREPRDSSPAEWSESERRRSDRLTRRASHMDLRRTRSSRRSSVYGSEAPSPEPFYGNRAVSLEVLAGAGARRETERGLELARLMGEAEKLGFSAAEVHAALAQNPAAPLGWLRERWPSLCAGVRAAAVRLAPGAVISEREARTALARHRGAMWPAVTDCVEKWRRQTETLGVETEGRLRHVLGSPTGAEDEAVPPLDRSHRIRAEESSDELEMVTPAIYPDDDWMFLPLESNKINDYENTSSSPQPDVLNRETEDIAQKLKSLLIQAGIPNINEQLLLKGLLFNQKNVKNNKANSNDFLQSENDFIDAYNALTRRSPLPNLNELKNNIEDQESPSKDTKVLSEELINKGNNSLQLSNNKSNKLKNTQNTLEVNESPHFQKLNEMSKIQNGPSRETPEKPTTIIGSDNVLQDITKLENKQDLGNNIEVNKEQEITEKSNNLTDMVDNTQKLIQQMKKELHSDIRSLVSRGNTESDVSHSSNDSELSSDKETSYSDTENETEELSSDENESKPSHSAIDNNSRHSMVNRTSSEDNEQFEEAIDHIEENFVNQIQDPNNHEQDFKQTNIEILDSIAKTLQEDHLLSARTKSKKLTHNKSIDISNNFFDIVNSFEEIYDQLANNTEKIAQKKIDTINQEIEINNNEQNSTQFYKLKPTKQVINFVNYAVQPSTTIFTSEIKLSPHNGTIEINNYEVENIDSSQSIEIEFPTLVDASDITQNNFHTEHTTFKEITNIFINDSEVLTETEEVIATQSLIETDTIPQSHNETQDTESVVSETINDNVSPESQNKQVNSDTKDFGGVSTDNEDQNTIKSEENFPLSEVKTTHQTLSKETAPENSLGILNNKGVLTKSNIPKLVKAIQNNKVKIEKTAAKFLSSKVPIRRTSLKQYPAPAPPKAHFGNVQNGHVKQLQTRLFTDKVQKPTNLVTEEIKPSTSTNNTSKKKPAPQPPTEIEHKNQSPPKEISQAEKNQFFRETCRTEDEWTDSESEDNQMQIVKKKDDSAPTPLSPPPPVTLRRVSGQLIDLATISLPEGSPERQARMLLAEGAAENWDQAQLAVELISRGTDPPSALLAALECTDLSTALAYLHQDCELCASRLPEYEMVSMLRCTHRCCRECARHYFTVQITERSIADCVCPYCKEPELENLPEDSWLEYFAHLDILLKTLLDTDVHELFQRKLRDRTLARDPNFKWCVECSSGFFVHPKQKKLRCPECKSISCASCRKPWSPNHEGLTCEQYTKWMDDNDPERSVAAVQQHLKENGLECPRCRFKYSLSRGGCMHFTCTQCKYEFCYGCGKPFMMGARCGLSEYCAKLGLHAHHPRNCLFYLRDKEPHELQTLLQMNNVTYETEPAEGSTGRCPIQLQRETPTGLVDGPCGSESSPNNAGLCKNHYLEYLSRLVRGQNVDPLPILGVDDLEILVRRAALRLPPRPYGSLEGLYKRALIEIVRDKIPLD